MGNFYQILGVPENAAAPEIKRAYRRLCMLYHPDKTGGDKHAEEKLRQVLEAYDILGDAYSRQLYDERLAWMRRSPPPPPSPVPPPPRPPRDFRQTPIPVPASSGMSRKVVIITTIVFITFFISLYLFWPQRPERRQVEQWELIPPATFTNLPKIRLDGGEKSLRDYVEASGQTMYMVQLDERGQPEIVMGNRLYALGADGVYQEVFRYDDGLDVDGGKIVLYYGGLTANYFGQARLHMDLPFDGPAARVALRYVEGRLSLDTTDQERNLILLRNLQAIHEHGIPETVMNRADDGTRKEMIRHFIAFHFNNDNLALTRRIFDRFYTASDREAVWHDLDGMISQLDKKITSALAQRH